MKVMEVSLVGGTGYTQCARETDQGFRDVGGGRITARGTTPGDYLQIVSDGYTSQVELAAVPPSFFGIKIGPLGTVAPRNYQFSASKFNFNGPHHNVLDQRREGP